MGKGISTTSDGGQSSSAYPRLVEDIGSSQGGPLRFLRVTLGCCVVPVADSESLVRSGWFRRSWFDPLAGSVASPGWTFVGSRHLWKSGGMAVALCWPVSISRARLLAVVSVRCCGAASL